MFSLHGQLAVVTGARRGIGRAATVALAQAGADIIGVSLNMPRDGGEVGDAVRAAGRSFEGFAVDFSDRKDADDFVAQVVPRQPQIVVSNAGEIHRSPALELSDEFWDRTIEVDLTSHFRLIRGLGAGMVAAGRGRVIMTASLLSFQGGLNVAAYSAAKSGIVGLVKALSNEWAATGVTVNAIAPGYVATDATRALQSDPVRNQAIIDRIPAGRWATPEDIGGTVVYLASAASAYVTGTVIPVDGGWLGR